MRDRCQQLQRPCGQHTRVEDAEHGRITNFESVFGCGNVITGKGNLVASRKHSRKVSTFLAERLGEDATPRGDLNSLLALIREQQAAVGYDDDYANWISRFANTLQTAASQ